jgi:hypothetical protein
MRSARVNLRHVTIRQHTALQASPRNRTLPSKNPSKCGFCKVEATERYDYCLMQKSHKFDSLTGNARPRRVQTAPVQRVEDEGTGYLDSIVILPLK